MAELKIILTPMSVAPAFKADIGRFKVSEMLLLNSASRGLVPGFARKANLDTSHGNKAFAKGDVHFHDWEHVFLSDVVSWAKIPKVPKGKEPVNEPDSK